MNKGKRGNKAQVAVEFLMIVAVLFTIFVVYTAVTRSRMNQLLEEEEYLLLKDTAQMTKEELVIAAAVNDGYYRQIEIDDILGYTYNYTIEKSGDNLVFTSENNVYVVRVPEYNGTIVKGINDINKTGGVVYVNQGS